MDYIEKQEPAMMKTEEVAALMGVGVDTVRRWLRTGKLKGVKIGKHYFISKEEIGRLTA
ncbi:MAG: helix-turn-helix domain-containing protein [Candidatus Thermoplasmatota archaeon]|nr:helix-turn-helix domain-containing protein [Candidatus Thermoplasmatota archaeon]